MTIADIFDALTASDRPYKKAVPIDRALSIIESEVKAGKCDAELFRVFVEGEVYKRVICSRGRSTDRSCGGGRRERSTPTRAGALAARVRAALRALGRARSSACLVLTDDDEIRDAQPRLPQARSRDRRAQLSPAGAGGRGRSGGRRRRAGRHRHLASRPPAGARPASASSPSWSGWPSTASATCSATTTRSRPRRR